MNVTQERHAERRMIYVVALQAEIPYVDPERKLRIDNLIESICATSELIGIEDGKKLERERRKQYAETRRTERQLDSNKGVK